MLVRAALAPPAVGHGQRWLSMPVDGDSAPQTPCRLMVCAGDGERRRVAQDQPTAMATMVLQHMQPRRMALVNGCAGHVPEDQA